MLKQACQASRCRECVDNVYIPDSSIRMLYYYPLTPLITPKYPLWRQWLKNIDFSQLLPFFTVIWKITIPLIEHLSGTPPEVLWRNQKVINLSGQATRWSGVAAYRYMCKKKIAVWRHHIPECLHVHLDKIVTRVFTGDQNVQEHLAKYPYWFGHGLKLEFTCATAFSKNTTPTVIERHRKVFT